MTNKERYQQLCDAEPSICVYDQPWWMDAVCGAENWDVLLYEKKGNLLGAMPYYVKSRYGLKYITQPPFTQHNGVWIKYPENQVESKRISLEKEVISGLIEQLESLPVCHYQQTHSPTLTNWLPFYWKGYQQTTRYTYRLEDIHDPEALLTRFQYQKRKNVEKARAHHLTLRFDLTAQEFFNVHQTGLAKMGNSIHYSLDLFQRIYDAAYAHDAGRVLYLTDETDKILCAMFNIWDRRYGYDLITAFDPDGRKIGAPDLLVYSMLEYLSDKVCGYDFEGSMIEGVEESFRHFGAAQTPYFTIRKTYTKNPLLRAAINQKMQ